MNPTYNPVRRLDDSGNIPPNSDGKAIILKSDLDDNNAVLATLIERMVFATFSAGGVVSVGTVAQSGDAVDVSNRLGITKDAKQFCNVPSSSYDFSGEADGFYLLVMVPTAQTVARGFTDPETGQALTHTMVDEIGALDVQFDAGAYPTLDDGAVACAQVQVTSGSIVAFTVVNTDPTLRY